MYRIATIQPERRVSNHPVRRRGVCVCAHPHFFLSSFVLSGWYTTADPLAEDRGRADQDQGRQGVEGPYGDGLPLRDPALAESHLLLPAPSAQEVPQVRTSAYVHRQRFFFFFAVRGFLLHIPACLSLHASYTMYMCGENPPAGTGRVAHGPTRRRGRKH